jgi:hypothetical protein
MGNNPSGGKHLCERADLSVSQNWLTTSPHKHAQPTPIQKPTRLHLPPARRLRDAQNLSQLLNICIIHFIPLHLKVYLLLAKIGVFRG